MNLHLPHRVLHWLLLLGVIWGCFQSGLVEAADLLWKPNGTTYETYLQTRVREGYSGPFTGYVKSSTNHEFSSAPLSSSLSNAHWNIINGENYSSGYAFAVAQVQGLELYVNSREYPQTGSAQASAVSVTAFSSSIDQIVSFEIQARGTMTYYTGGFISLLDVTADRPLWYQHWGYFGANTITGFGASRPEPFLTYEYDNKLSLSSGSITLIQETQLLQDHDYRLVMYAQGSANGDSETIFLSVVVPEPTTLSLVTLGLLSIMRRIRRNYRN